MKVKPAADRASRSRAATGLPCLAGLARLPCPTRLTPNPGRVGLGGWAPE
jgi:hypothetical protein